MSGNFSVIQEGSTLISDHKTAVQALEEVLACTSAGQAKKTAKAALQKLGELEPGETILKPEPPVDDMVTRKQ